MNGRGAGSTQGIPFPLLLISLRDFDTTERATIPSSVKDHHIYGPAISSKGGSGIP